MIARAPGKLVLSGAYAVLWGAPAIVTAVDRYVTADSARPAEFITPEVSAALGARATSNPEEAIQGPPAFDASELRSEHGKLGLGSSAAILVASLGALETAPLDEARRNELLGRALLAHRTAQGGGSGIDVVASVFGGTLIVRSAHAGASVSVLGELRLANRDLALRHDAHTFQQILSVPQVEPVSLPAGLDWSVWFSGHPASTASLLAAVKRLEELHPKHFGSILLPHLAASEAAAVAAARGDATSLLDALGTQLEQLRLLGEAAEIPIVTPEILELGHLARAEAALCMPSGAGGGDVMLRVGLEKPSAAFEIRASELGFLRLHLLLGAPGLHIAQPNES